MRRSTRGVRWAIRAQLVRSFRWPSAAGHLPISSFHSCQELKTKKTWESPLQSLLLHPQRGKFIRATYLPIFLRTQLLLSSPPPAPSPGLIISRDSTRNSDGQRWRRRLQRRRLSRRKTESIAALDCSVSLFLSFLSSTFTLALVQPTDRPQTEVERATNMAWKEARKAAALFVKPPSHPDSLPAP